MQIATAQEYYGKFLDALKGKFVEAKPRPKFKLSSRFRFRDPNSLLWTVPARTEVDGASIPQVFWSFIGGPFDGPYINASIVHDHYCDKKSRTDHDTHRNFYYGMRASGVEVWKAKFMYWAVAAFGPKWTLTNRVSQRLMYDYVGGKLVYTQVSRVKEEITPLPAADLSDPDVLGAVLSKASTVARSLKTTGGDILDVTATGQVTADLDSIANNATHYYAVLAGSDFLRRPEQLGVLSIWDAAGLERVKPWENNKFPTFRGATILKQDSIKIVRGGKHFKLDRNSTGLLRKQIDFKSLKMKSTQFG